MVDTALVTAPDGRTIAYAEWGVRHGWPLVLLHGCPGSRYVRHVGGLYERHHVRAIAYDLPGYGLSTRRPGHRVVDAAEDVALITDQLGIDEFAVLGISAGGPRALAVAARLPERVTRCVTELSPAEYAAADLEFFAGMSEADVGEWERPAAHDAAWLAEHDFRDLVAWLDEPDPVPEVSGELHDMLLQAFREGIVNGPGGYVDDLISLSAPWGFTLDEVKVPTRVMAGTEDEGIPRQHTEWLVAGIPDAEPVWSPGGHIADHSAAEERLIGWLAGARS
ncbi:alpha/beta fold hydrolase [Kribbella sp. NPDC055110]